MTIEKMLREIRRPEIRAVSFDVFDTLLLRPFFSPQDLFSLVGALGKESGHLDISPMDFLRARVRAEKLARAAAPEREITLGEIYERLQSLLSLDKRQSEWVAACEIRTETEAAFARRSGIGLFHAAAETGKPVVCLSDMYLPMKTLQTMLTRAEIRPDRLFVSSETGKSKFSGKLFTMAAEELGISPGELLHIGDDPFSDGTQAEKAGVSICRLPSVREVWSRGHGFIPRKIPNRCALAAAINRRYDDPFEENGPADDTAYDCLPERYGHLINSCSYYPVEAAAENLRYIRQQFFG